MGKMKETTLEELRGMPEDAFVLIDVRDGESAAYGMIPGAVGIPAEELRSGESSRLSAIPGEKILVLYCQTGRKSLELEGAAGLEGREVYSLRDGYIGYVRSRAADESDPEERRRKAEDSIRRKFHEELFTPFARACRNYQLISDGDRIAVCMSGGKDSMLMAKLFQEIRRHRKVRFDLVFLVMDPGYNRENRALIESNARLLGIPVTFFESGIFDAVDQIEKNPCYLCARMRRGYLYSEAKALGCNKIALGHHYDDVIETVLMGMLHSGQYRSMMPKLHSSNFEGMELIRPMYLIRESDICAWRDYNDLVFLQCACHFTETCATCHEDGTTASKRLETKQLIAALKRDNPYVESNIFNSMANVDLDAVIGYRKNGRKHSFLEEY